MRRPRFPLISLMFLVLLAALGMAASVHLSRLNREDFLDQAAFLGGFLAMIALKMGVVAGARWRRLWRSEGEPSSALSGPSPPSSSEDRG